METAGHDPLTTSNRTLSTQIPGHKWRGIRAGLSVPDKVQFGSLLLVPRSQKTQLVSTPVQPSRPWLRLPL